jgi:hypothetical protein
MMAMTHHALVSEAMGHATAADRLAAMGCAAGEIYTGLTDEDGAKLSVEWRRMFTDLAACGPRGIAGWAAVFGESTGNWWPPGSSLLTRGVVNAIVRSPTVEDLHAGDRMSFYDSQLGAMCANWAAVSLLDPVVGPDPAGWGTTNVDHVVDDRLYSAAADLFPAGWAVIDALGQCLSDAVTNRALELPAGTADNAHEWLATHTGESRETDAKTSLPSSFARRSVASVRHAWSAPDPDSFDLSAEVQAIGTPSLTRLSRHPLHLAAVLDWAVRTGVSILTPNVLIEPTGVAYRQPLAAAPGIATGALDGQAFHSESWTDSTGLSARHAQRLGLTTSGEKPGRNAPCPCGSGAKYKHCHGR